MDLYDDYDDMIDDDDDDEEEDIDEEDVEVQEVSFTPKKSNDLFRGWPRGARPPSIFGTTKTSAVSTN